MSLEAPSEAPSEAPKLELLSRDGNLPMALMESHLHMEGKSTTAAVFHDRGRDDIEMKEMMMTYGAKPAGICGVGWGSGVGGTCVE